MSIPSISRLSFSSKFINDLCSKILILFYSRYKMRKRFPEMQGLITKSITDLGELKQNELVGDIFEIYFNEHVKKMRSNEEEIKLVENEYLF